MKVLNLYFQSIGAMVGGEFGSSSIREMGVSGESEKKRSETTTNISNKNANSLFCLLYGV